MMHRKWRKQTALYWKASGFDDYGQPKGEQYVVLSPDDNTGVWYTCKRTQIRDTEGNNVTLDATLYADRAVPVGSVFFLGEEADWFGTGSGDPELYEAVVYDRAYDVRGKDEAHLVGLQKYKGSLPELV